MLNRRNLNLCFTKIKLGTAESTSSTSSPAPAEHSRPLTNSATTKTASIFIRNFNSLFDLTLDNSSTTASNSKSLRHYSASVSESDSETTATPDFATAVASRRFFFSSPGRSNSIIDSSSLSSSSSATAEPSDSDNLVGGGVAIPTYSPDPFNDFRRSMQEMVEARDLVDVRENWEHLHELLTCYLALNPKSTHKFILGAFADLLVSLMTSPARRGGGESDFAGVGCSVSRRSV